MIDQQHINFAFTNYEFARALLIRCAVSGEFIADSPFELPPAKELAQSLQDISRIACAVTNQDGFNGKRYTFWRAEGDCPDKVMEELKQLQPNPSNQRPDQESK